MKKCQICKKNPMAGELKGKDRTIAFCLGCLPWNEFDFCAPGDRLDLDQLYHYFACLLEGTAPSLALMFATAQGPGLQTDSVFCSGGREEDQYKDPRLREARQRAEKKGVNTSGKIYMSGLARFPGDPTAWVDGRGDVARICQERGWGCEGTVAVKGDVELALAKSCDPLARAKLKEALKG